MNDYDELNEINLTKRLSLNLFIDDEANDININSVNNINNNNNNNSFFLSSISSTIINRLGLCNTSLNNVGGSLGVIVQGGIGCGKTSLLTTLKSSIEFYCNNESLKSNSNNLTAIYIDFSNLIQCSRRKVNIIYILLLLLLN
jgi:hypothetical protein